MSVDLKPWEAGYEAPPSARMSAKEAGAMGGTKAQSRKRAGLPPEPVSDGTKKKGAKRTSVAREEKFANMTEETIPLAKKVFLDKFVYEYLHDFNSSMAYIRAGGAASHATTGGPDSLRTQYVQEQLRLVTEMMDVEKLVTAGEVLMGLKREANYFGEDGSSASRVRAWGMLAKIKGMDAPKPPPDEGDKGPKGGVMEIPAYTDVQWNEVAAQSQAQLKNDVRN